MSYFFVTSPLSFGMNLWQAVKSTITRTQANLELSVESKIVPCSLPIAAKTTPIIETSSIYASSYQVRSFRCERLTTPFAFERCLPVIIDKAECKELPKIESLSNQEKECSSINDLLALDSLREPTSSNDMRDISYPEILEVHAEPEPSSSKPNCAPSSFLAFLEASHLEMSERLRSQQPKSAPLDLGCAQFNSAYYRRHPPATLSQLKVNQPSRKSFCWQSKLDEIMRESGEECDETVKESFKEFEQEFTRSSCSNSRHSRSSSILSDRTCVESPELLVISSVKELESTPLSIASTHSNTLSQPILDDRTNQASPCCVSSCTPTSFLAFPESSNLEMLKRIQEKKSKTIDLGCVQYNLAYYRRHLPPRLPKPEGSKTSTKEFCWKSTLDQLMRDEECENLSTDIVKKITTKPKRKISSSTTYTSSPHVRSAICSSNTTCVEEMPSLIYI